MAEDNENRNEQEPPQEAAARKSGLAQEWRRLATWQKAGVLIGGGALVVAVMIYINRQQTPAATGNDTTGNTALMPPGSAVGYPGEGDQFPPVPVAPTPQQPAPGKPTTPTAPTTPRKPVGGPIMGPGPVAAPPKKVVPLHTAKGDLVAREPLSTFNRQRQLNKTSQTATSIFGHQGNTSGIGLVRGI